MLLILRDGDDITPGVMHKCTQTQLPTLWSRHGVSDVCLSEACVVPRPSLSLYSCPFWSTRSAYRS